jgi:hypothetical protein
MLAFKANLVGIGGLVVFLGSSGKSLLLLNLIFTD